MRCLVCDSTDKWKNVDEFRIKKKGMSLCESCGFVSYPELYKTEEEIKSYYRGNEYRKPPNVNNVYTGQRKLHLHEPMLRDVFKGWKESGIEDPVIGEQGAAYGLLLNWCRRRFPKADVSGTELTLSYRRNAWQEYQVRLTEDFDTSKKYDLLMSYKVAEHQLDADHKIREMVECLKPNGLLYISVPTWFGQLTNFGMSGFDIEYYYSTDHVNTWTKKLFETVLKKCGAEIIKHDGYLYDDTYICKRNDELMKETPVYEDPKHIIDCLTRIKKVHEANEVQDFEGSLKAWNDYPQGYVNYYESKRQQFHKEGFGFITKFLENALEKTDRSAVVLALCGDVFMRYEKWEKAIEFFNEFLEKRPNSTKVLDGISQCLRHLADKTVKDEDYIKLISEARNIHRHIKSISFEDFGPSTNWVFADNANIPTPDEVQL